MGVEGSKIHGEAKSLLLPMSVGIGLGLGVSGVRRMRGGGGARKRPPWVATSGPQNERWLTLSAGPEGLAMVEVK